MTNSLADRKIQLEKVKLWRDILLTTVEIIGLLVEDANKRRRIRNCTKSILMNACELHTGIRPNKNNFDLT